MGCGRSCSLAEQREAGVEENVCPKCGRHLVYAYRGKVGGGPGNRSQEVVDIFEGTDVRPFTTWLDN